MLAIQHKAVKIKRACAVSDLHNKIQLPESNIFILWQKIIKNAIKVDEFNILNNVLFFDNPRYRVSRK
jgi:hypothetical protein